MDCGGILNYQDCIRSMSFFSTRKFHALEFAAAAASCGRKGCPESKARNETQGVILVDTKQNLDTEEASNPHICLTAKGRQYKHERNGGYFNPPFRRISLSNISRAH